MDSTPKYDKWIILEKYLIWCFHSQAFSRTVVDWFMCLGIEHHRILSCSLYIYTLMDGFHLPISQLTYMSFCTQGLPGVAESTETFSEGTPFSWGECARQGGWGVRKSILVCPSPTVCDVNPLPKGKGYVGGWILRLCLRHRAEWPVEGSVGKSERFISEWLTIRESGALCMGDLLVLYIVIWIVDVPIGYIDWGCLYLV